MAVGSRAHLQAAATAKRSWYRNLLMRGFHLLVVLVAGSAVKDTQCGFKARPCPKSCTAHPMRGCLPPSHGMKHQ